MNKFTSDTHFNHEKILEFSRHDYKTTDEMNWDIVKIWNEIVTPDDDVWHMGDFAFKTGQKKEETRNLFTHLQGHTNLMIGNHDYLKKIGDFPFASIQREAFITIRGIKFRMAHFPYPWGRTEKDLRERPECMTEPVIDTDTGKNFPLLCGHVHSTWMTRKDCLNVGWDIFHKPIGEDTILEIFDKTNGFQKDLDNLHALV
jgi:calcineurin-like phosphoesterase family protein